MHAPRPATLIEEHRWLLRLFGATSLRPTLPQIYGPLKLRMEPALAYLEQLRRRTGRKVTVTHLVVKAIGDALAACPQANVVLRAGRPHQRARVDVSVLVALTTARDQDLSATKLCDVAALHHLSFLHAQPRPASPRHPT